MDTIGVFVISLLQIMKKKIVSLLLLGMYFFGGFGVVFAISDGSTETTATDGTSTKVYPDGTILTFDKNGDITSNTDKNGKFTDLRNTSK
jgi:hypothetical protein